MMDDSSDAFVSGAVKYDLFAGHLDKFSVTFCVENLNFGSDFTKVIGNVTDYQLGLDDSKGCWAFAVQFTKATKMFRVFVRYQDCPRTDDIPVHFRAILQFHPESVAFSRIPHGFDFEEAANTRYAVRSDADQIHLFMSEEIHQGFLPAEMNIKCKMQFLDSWYIKQFRTGGPFLRRNLSELYTSKRLSDFTLVSSDGREHVVHRCILDAGSPVFRAMFDTDMAEKSSGKAKITDIDGETLESLLSFLYGHDIRDKLDDIAEELFIAADKYQIPDLKAVCSMHLSEGVSVTNAARLLILANELDEPDLSFAALKCIGRSYNAFKTAGGLEQLREHDGGKLAFTVMDYLGNKLENTRKRSLEEYLTEE